MIRSTFAGFNTAQLAMMASQRGLDVTGQNLSNINTTGYTRQRLDLLSLNPVGNSIGSYFLCNTGNRLDVAQQHQKGCQGNKYQVFCSSDPVRSFFVHHTNSVF